MNVVHFRFCYARPSPLSRYGIYLNALIHTVMYTSVPSFYFLSIAEDCARITVSVIGEYTARSHQFIFQLLFPSCFQDSSSSFRCQIHHNSTNRSICLRLLVYHPAAYFEIRTRGKMINSDLIISFLSLDKVQRMHDCRCLVSWIHKLFLRVDSWTYAISIYSSSSTAKNIVKSRRNQRCASDLFNWKRHNFIL